MIFSYTPTYTTVKCNLIEKRTIKGLLSARPEGFQFAPKFKKGWWNGYISLLDKQNRFPSGLLNYILTYLDDNNYNYDVTGYDEVIFPFKLPEIPGYDFRPNQIEAVKRVLKYQRGVLKMATNAGKTLVTAGIIQLTGHKAVVIVPNQALLTQTITELETMLGVPIGQFGGGMNVKKDVTVTTMASLNKLVKTDLSDNITLIVDESHHSKSDQIFDHIFSIPADIRIGMSGTPLTYEQLGDLKLTGATGDIIYEVTNAELIDAGYSSKPIIKFYKLTEPKIPTKTTYQVAYNVGIVNNKYRNDFIATIAQRERMRGPVLIICNWVEHVNNIASLNDSFLWATGNTSKTELAVLMESYNESNDVLVVSPIFGEGVNIPSVATVIMASGNKSHIQILQRIGRGLRRTDDKDVVHIYDFIDATHRYLLKHSEERYKLYKEEGFHMEMV